MYFSFFLSVCIFSAYASAWRLIWSDEFDKGSVDHNNWNYDLQDGCQIHRDLCGWGNNELQWYTDNRKNSFVKDGNLVIQALRENIGGRQYSSARLVTRGKAQWRYGKFEIRAKLPKGKGLWPAIWMLPSHGSWPRGGELDIMEYLGHETNIVYGSAHFGNSPSDKGSTSSSYRLPWGVFDEDFHVFELKWREDKIEWLVDGNTYHTLTRSDVGSYPYPFDADFHLLLNLAVGGNWPGHPNDETKFPAHFVIDYVKVYSQ